MLQRAAAERQQAVFDRLLQEYAKPVYLDLDLDSFILTLLKDWARDNKNWQTACLHQQELLLKSAGNDQWRKNYLLEQTNALLEVAEEPVAGWRGAVSWAFSAFLVTLPAVYSGSGHTLRSLQVRMVG
ncbi:MAG: hypothetical protein R3E89_12790 [Thiolinea sp.]